MNRKKINFICYLFNFLIQLTHLNLSYPIQFHIQTVSLKLERF